MPTIQDLRRTIDRMNKVSGWEGQTFIWAHSSEYERFCELFGKRNVRLIEPITSDGTARDPSPNDQELME